MSASRATLPILGVIHAGNDLLAGWILGGLVSRTTPGAWLVALVLYSALAFAGQFPTALSIERGLRPRFGLTLALGSMCAAGLLCAALPLFGVVLAGVASALVHVCGGVMALDLRRRERSFGWFCAPGVLGVTLGGWLGHSFGLPAPTVVLVPAVLLGAWLGLDRAAAGTSALVERNMVWPAPGSTRVVPGGRTTLVILLLLALTSRSAIWDVVQAMRAGNTGALAALALSAALGKLFGGFISERWNNVRSVALLLVAAGFLLDCFGHDLAVACVGIALLQSTIPAAVVLLFGDARMSSSLAVACGLGLTVALGGIAALIVPPSFLLHTLPAIALLLAWRASIGERSVTGGGGIVTTPVLLVDERTTSVTVHSPKSR